MIDFLLEIDPSQSAFSVSNRVLFLADAVDGFGWKLKPFQNKLESVFKLLLHDSRKLVGDSLGVYLYEICYNLSVSSEESVVKLYEFIKNEFDNPRVQLTG